jgi:hypothetical protein
MPRPPLPRRLQVERDTLLEAAPVVATAGPIVLGPTAAGHGYLRCCCLPHRRRRMLQTVKEDLVTRLGGRR